MSDSLEISFFLNALRRRLRLVVLCVLLGVLVALVTGLGPRSYRASAQLLVVPPSGGGAEASGERYVTSQVSVLQSRETARRVAQRMGGVQTPEDVQEVTRIAPVAGSDVIAIEAVTDDVNRSLAIADAYTRAYSESTDQRARASVAPELRRLDERLADLRRRIDVTNRQLAQAVAPFLRRQNRTNPPPVPDPRTVAPAAAASQQLLLNEYDRLLAQRQTLEQQQQAQGRSVVLQPAVADDAPIGPDRRRQLAIVAVAFLVGAAAAVARAAFSRRVVSDAEAEQALGRPLAAHLPAERRLRRTPLGVEHPKRGSTSEERMLWLKVERLFGLGMPGVAVALGAAAGSGTTTVALALARQFARAGRDVVLVDAVGGPGSLTASYGAQDAPGLTGLLDGSAGPGVLTPTQTPGLQLLPRGQDVGGLDEREFRAVVTALSARHDVVILDTQPASVAAIKFASSVEAAVLAVPAGRLELDEVREVGLLLSGVSDRLLPVLTHARARRGRAAPGRAVRRDTESVLRRQAEPTPTP